MLAIPLSLSFRLERGHIGRINSSYLPLPAPLFFLTLHLALDGSKGRGAAVRPGIEVHPGWDRVGVMGGGRTS